ncbi:hypothetical protein ACF5W4_05775 [Bacillota bacterium Lsc_1132]
MSYPNFRDFYQKALIPIGNNDRTVFSSEDVSFPPLLSTHWLIALEGELKPEQSRDYYYWKVSIYSANADGTFNWDQAFYTSPGIDSIDEAIELARTFETYSKNDELHISNLQEKIS